MEGRKEDGHKPASEENILQVGLEMAQATSKCSREPSPDVHRADLVSAREI